MAYCIKCGVELSEYIKACPLCETEVLNGTENEEIINSDYPDYRMSPKDETKRVKHIFAGKILSVLFFDYAIILLILNILINKTVSWSMIPVLSLVLCWFGVAYPFFRKHNTFFRLFTMNCIAVIVYLLSLNLIISGDILWSRIAGLSIALLWVIMAGFFIPERIRKILPVTVYYILSSVILFVVITLLIGNQLSIFQVVLPLTILLLVLSLVSYFVIVARANDFLGMSSVILFDISVFCLVLDIIIVHYTKGTYMPSWSIIVNIVTIPLFATVHTIKKSRELKSLISKKLHR
ncbi:MAG: hypothetical protein KAQ68_01835 [Clostridiales bacterium]|nr:hypothetical protein [Clostridiales bacterium]